MVKNYLSLIRWDKPIGSFLLLWPTLWALYVASSSHPPLLIVAIFVLEVFLTRSAGCVINDIADANLDKQVERTKNRPLACGAITKKTAVGVFVSLSLFALGLALIYLNLPTILLSIPALLILISYPFTKRFFALPQAYLGIAYSFGILMAFMQILGYLPVAAWLLFSANLFWVLGYDTIYAMLDKSDDIKIGIYTAVLTLGQYVVPAVAGFYACFLLFMLAFGLMLSLTIIYWLSFSLAVLFLAYQIYQISLGQKADYLAMFKLNNWVGLILLIGIMGGFNR